MTTEPNDAAEPTDQPLLHTPLYDWHLTHGARMGGFAGYDMPIRYGEGTIAEHNHTRAAAGLFDVSHMGVAELHASSGQFADVAAAIELFVPCDVDLLNPGRQRYTQLLNEDGGIIDDLMISRSTRLPNVLTIVSNAGRKDEVFAYLSAYLPNSVKLVLRPEVALIALQGPQAEAALCRLTDDSDIIQAMRFMDVVTVKLCEVEVGVSRSGYTGEDGFELSINASDVVRIANALVEQSTVMPVGLGARDTLRLEAGLCLYGADIDVSTSPIEAGLGWSIQKRRRQSLGFHGANRISDEIQNGVARRLVGLVPNGRAPIREHALLFASDSSEVPIGMVTSGGFSPTLGKPIAVGYVAPEHATVGMTVVAEVRGNRLSIVVTDLPFVAHTYKR
jgi:aminomethyltransferase